MLTKIWQLKGVFVLVGLFAAFAACVKEKDPNVDRNEIRDALGVITTAVNNGDLGTLNKYFVQPTPEGAGPNRLISLLTAGDSAFAMHNRKFSIDGERQPSVSPRHPTRLTPISRSSTSSTTTVGEFSVSR